VISVKKNGYLQRLDWSQTTETKENGLMELGQTCTYVPGASEQQHCAPLPTFTQQKCDIWDLRAMGARKAAWW
jgi:hypothetical protein